MSMVEDRVAAIKQKLPAEVLDELTDKPLSRVMRRQTWPDHARAEYSDFEQALAKGTISKEAYRDLLVQVLPVYEALEARGAELADDPIAGPIVIDALHRTEPIRRDIEFYFSEDGDDPADVEILDVTEEYVERIRNATPEQFVAHHYTRHLADLSGGVFIDMALKQAWGLEEDGRRYYQFDDIPDGNMFKDAYRGTLDELPIDAAQKRVMIEEVLVAYEFNIVMATELAKRHKITSPTPVS